MLQSQLWYIYVPLSLKGLINILFWYLIVWLSSRLFYISHILDIVTSIYGDIDNNQYTGMVIFDIAKAFDTVCYKRLLIKLDHYEISETAFKLMQSYLNNRLEDVCINNINSKSPTVEMFSTSKFCFRLSPISNLY